MLETSDVIRYPNATNTVMVEVNGTVRHENGDLSFTPFTRHLDLANSETLTNVTEDRSDTTVAIANNIGGAFGAYIAQFSLVYQTRPPDPADIAVTYVDDQTLYFSWESGGGSTAGYRVAVADGEAAGHGKRRCGHDEHVLRRERANAG